MRCMVLKLEVVIDNGMVDVVGSDQVFKCTLSFIRRLFDVVYLD